MTTNGMALLNVGSLGSRSALGVQSLVDMRRQLDELQRQLGSGKKSETYAGLGIDRGLLVGLQNRFTTLEAFGSSIDNVDVRLNMAQTALGRLVSLRGTVKSAAFQQGIQGNGSAIAQTTAASSLNEMLGLLNTQIGDRYAFSGLSPDKPSVASYDLIMDGDATRAGFKQVVSERRQADLGTLGLGRLVITPPTPTSVQIAEEAPPTVFG